MKRKTQKCVPCPPDHIPLQDYRKSFGDQAIVHFRENTILVSVLEECRDALRDAIRLLDATRRNEWTPADTKRLEEIRATAS